MVVMSKLPLLQYITIIASLWAQVDCPNELIVQMHGLTFFTKIIINWDLDGPTKSIRMCAIWHCPRHCTRYNLVGCVELDVNTFQGILAEVLCFKKVECSSTIIQPAQNTDELWMDKTKLSFYCPIRFPFAVFHKLQPALSISFPFLVPQKA
jgi:hypothetical protein